MRLSLNQQPSQQALAAYSLVDHIRRLFARNLLLMVAWLLTVASPCIVSSQVSSSAALDQMRKLDFLVGEWKGTGWQVNWDGSRGDEFSQKSRVQVRSGGSNLQIKDARNYKTKTIGLIQTSTLDATIYYDEVLKIYRWRGENSYGRKNPLEATLIDTKTLQYGIPFIGNVQLPNGARRTTITVTASGEWHETLDVWKIDRWYKAEESLLTKVK